MSSPPSIPIYRDDDGELLGHLEPVTELTQDDAQHDDSVRRTHGPDEAGLVTRWRPCTVFGFPMGEPVDRDDAEQLLQQTGLSYLADRWETLMPGSSEWARVDLLEASPGQVTVMVVDFGQPDRYGERLVISTSDGDVTRRLRRG